MNEHYYSQIRQDKFLNEVIFNNKKDGFFIDIGAHDGVTYSNTLFFEKFRNWDGVCFEPNLNVFEKLVKNRRCKNYNVCIGNFNKKVKFTRIEGYSEMLSGVTESYHEKHLERIDNSLLAKGGKKEEVDIEMVRLDSIKELIGKNIDFISIDTEGNEFDIIESINFNDFKINTIVVENNYKDNRTTAFLEPLGFKLIHFLGPDEVFINECSINLGIRLRLMRWKLIGYFNLIESKIKTLLNK
jgi:FkbM family methyltransferase